MTQADSPQPDAVTPPVAPDSGYAVPPTEFVTRALAALMGVAITFLWLLMVFIVVSPLFTPDHTGDPHGYALVTGALLSVPLGAFAAITLPFALERSKRRRGFTVTVPIFAVGTALLFVVWFAST